MLTQLRSPLGAWDWAELGPRLGQVTLLVLLVTLLLSAAVLGFKTRDWLQRLRLRRRLRWASEGERTAEALLTRAGYTVLGRQVLRPWLVEVDAGRAHLNLGSSGESVGVKCRRRGSRFTPHQRCATGQPTGAVMLATERRSVGASHKATSSRYVEEALTQPRSALRGRAWCEV